MKPPFFRHKPKSARLSSVIEPVILLSIAMKNLLSKRLRTGLTIGGIIIGVGSIVFLVSLAEGLHQTVDNYVIGSQSIEVVDVTSPNSSTVPLTPDLVDKISHFDHVAKSIPSYILPGKISSNSSMTDAVLYGTDNQYISLSALKMEAGDGVLSNSKDVIISASLLDLIGQPNASSAINQQVTISTTMELNNQPAKDFSGDFKVVGVASIGSGVAVYMNGQVLSDAGAKQYGQAKVVADDRANVPTIRDQISSLGLATASPLDTLGEINSIFSVFTYVVIGFSGIGMVIAILGMFNTLTISLLERTSEISLMVIMGARKADVKRLLIFEALLLSLLGGTGGIVVAWLGGIVINMVLTNFANGRGVQGAIQAFSVTPLLVSLTLLFTMLVGLLVALYPARRAAKINPIESLRQE
ncbi:MAG: ABC transporter permease [Candidatus Saccharibacteria bacterium]